jgi:hypothetical protein
VLSFGNARVLFLVKENVMKPDKPTHNNVGQIERARSSQVDFEPKCNIQKG